MWPEQAKPTILMMLGYQIKKTMKEMIKNLVKVVAAMVLLLLAGACQDDDNSFGDIKAPTNLALSYEIMGQTAENVNGDGSGNVTLKADADNAITYKFIYPDGTSVTTASGQVVKRFTNPGIHSYEVTVIAYGKAGVSTTGTMTITDLLSTFDDPITVDKLTGGSSKVWYVAQNESGHLGVGPNDPAAPTQNYWAAWYMAQPNEKDVEGSSCLYTNKLTFTKEGNLIKYTLENEGTFFNGAYLPLVGQSGPDACAAWDVSGQKTVLLSPSESIVSPDFTTGTQMNFSDAGFMGYYVGTTTYEILELTDNRMVVRAVDGTNTALAWYQIFTTQNPNDIQLPEFNNLVWADEFDYTGAPDPTKWVPEIGTGNNGWGNGEAQYYRAENATVSNGTLKITAKKETYQGSLYTSARLKTHNKFDFTYGRVEFRAKLPSGGGTWPALWMLGSNYLSQPWPACGEIDIMEHIGNDVGNISSTLHYPGHSAGEADSTTKAVAGVEDDFKIYMLIWNEEMLRFYVKDSETATPVLIKHFTNSAAHPYFNWDYFIIMNVAMGGNLGGNINSNFTQSAMEVDYVRVYQ
jgi:Glycosyl hydrolases family 16